GLADDMAPLKLRKDLVKRLVRLTGSCRLWDILSVHVWSRILCGCDRSRITSRYCWNWRGLHCWLKLRGITGRLQIEWWSSLAYASGRASQIGRAACRER